MTPIIAYHGTRTNGWLRILGYGLWWKNRAHHRLYFSERNWHRPPHIMIGTWHLHFLGKPTEPSDEPSAGSTVADTSSRAREGIDERRRRLLREMRPSRPSS